MICSWGLIAFIKAADIRTYPKLSKTILPDHPLYPPDIRIGRAPQRRARNISGEATRTRQRQQAQQPVENTRVQRASVSSKNDIPISRQPQRQSQPRQTVQRQATPRQTTPRQTSSRQASPQRQTTQRQSQRQTTSRRTPENRRTPR